MNRRALLLGVAAGALAAPIVACQNGATPQTQLQTTSALVTAGVAAVAASVLATPNLDPAKAAQINAAVADVNAANAVIQQSAAVPGLTVQKLVIALKIAAPYLFAMLPASSPEAMALNAALSLIPVLFAAAGLPTPPPTASMLPESQRMTPEKAISYLQGYLHK